MELKEDATTAAATTAAIIIGGALFALAVLMAVLDEDHEEDDRQDALRYLSIMGKAVLTVLTFFALTLALRVTLLLMLQLPAQLGEAAMASLRARVTDSSLHHATWFLSVPLGRADFWWGVVGLGAAFVGLTHTSPKNAAVAATLAYLSATMAPAALKAARTPGTQLIRRFF
jgi:hypothetical protein